MSERRSIPSVLFALISLAILLALISTPLVLREWHAWQGHKYFLHKQFAYASSHLAHVREGQTLYATYYGVPTLNLHAQSLLVLGRDDEAVQDYALLADRSSRDAVPIVILALHDWMNAHREIAIARLAIAPETCNHCKATHEIFVSAERASSDVEAAARDQQKHLEAMKLPAQCAFYRSANLAADVAISSLTTFLSTGMTKLLASTGMTKQGIKFAIGVLQRQLTITLLESFADIERRATELGTTCAQKIQIHELLHLREIPVVRTIDDWLPFATLEKLADDYLYVGDAKEAIAVAPHLFELSQIAVSYAYAYKVGSDAVGLVQAADEHAKSMWTTTRLAAQDPDFSKSGLPKPKRGWFEITKAKIKDATSSIWPLR